MLKSSSSHQYQLSAGSGKENNKKKKIKHILSLDCRDVDFEQKISKKDVDSNAYIKKILKNFENS